MIRKCGWFQTAMYIPSDAVWQTVLAVCELLFGMCCVVYIVILYCRLEFRHHHHPHLRFMDCVYIIRIDSLQHMSKVMKYGRKRSCNLYGLN